VGNVERCRKYRKTHLEQCRNNERENSRNRRLLQTYKDRMIKYYLGHREEILAQNRKWKKEHRGQVQSYKAQRRKLGFVPFNQPFENSEAHHIDFVHVIYIPYKLHHSIYHNIWTGKGMLEMSDKVFRWLEEKPQSL
jgi:hypothetical protein